MECLTLNGVVIPFWASWIAVNRGVRVEPSRLPQRHTQLKAGRPPQELATSLPHAQRASSTVPLGMR